MRKFYVITEIHPFDAWYGDRGSLIGRQIAAERLIATNDNWCEGWCYVPGSGLEDRYHLDGCNFNFFRVRIAEST